MLNDKLWKNDLAQIIKELLLWSSKEYKRYNPKAEHIINRGLLYSAIIIRKATEDDKDAKPFFEEHSMAEQVLKTLYYNVPVLTYDYLPTDDFINKKCFPEYYDIENSEEMQLPLDRVCNQIIHSYKWGILYEPNSRGIHGVLFASDRFKGKCVYLLRIEDWINAIQFVIDNYCF